MTSPAAPSSVTRAVRRVGSRLARHLDADPARRRVHHDGVVARRQHEHVGEATAQYRRRRPGGRAPRHRDVRRQRDTAAGRPVGQARQPLRLQLVRSDGVDHRAGDDRRHEGPGVTARPSSSTTTTSSGSPYPDPPDRLGEVQPQPAELGQVTPERRQLPPSGLEEGPAAPRESCLARKSEAVWPRARWSSVMAIGMAKQYVPAASSGPKPRLLNAKSETLGSRYLGGQGPYLWLISALVYSAVQAPRPELLIGAICDSQAWKVAGSITHVYVYT